MCIAADSGIDHARALGRVPDLVVGDFDSVSTEGLAWAADRGATVEAHPANKDQTDLELALVRAVDHQPERIVVAAIGGGRFDHLLANVQLIADERFAAVPVDAYVDTALVSVVHEQRTLHGSVGETISLLPMHGDAVDVVTSGLGYPLRNERLRAGSSRGVSNYFAAVDASVRVGRGTLVAVQPDHLHAGSAVDHDPDA
jgi:thiamine pyrophosphokinase